jgi:hypothetical protein
MRRKTKACTKRPAESSADVKRLTGEVVTPHPNNMASIFEKEPLYKVVKAWDDNNPSLSEVYKLQSNNLQNKSLVEIHKDNGNYGIKFTINKTIPLSSTRELKNVTLTGQTPLWSSRMCSRAIKKQPGNKCFMSTSQSLLMQRCQYRLRKIVAWKKTSIKQFSSSFSKC